MSEARISREIAGLEEKTTELAGELQALYGQYLDALGQSAQQSLVSAAFYLCTNRFPDAFLGLSYRTREKLQRAVSHLGQTLREDLSHDRLSQRLTQPSPAPTASPRSRSDRRASAMERPETSHGADSSPSDFPPSFPLRALGGDLALALALKNLERQSLPPDSDPSPPQLGPAPAADESDSSATIEPTVTADLDPNPGADPDLDSSPDPGPDVDPDPDLDSNPDLGPDVDPDPDVDSNSDPGLDPDLDADTDTDTDSNSDSGLDPGPDPGPRSDTNPPRPTQAEAKPESPAAPNGDPQAQSPTDPAASPKGLKASLESRLDASIDPDTDPTQEAEETSASDLADDPLAKTAHAMILGFNGQDLEQFIADLARVQDSDRDEARSIPPELALLLATQTANMFRQSVPSFQADFNPAAVRNPEKLLEWNESLEQTIQQCLRSASQAATQVMVTHKILPHSIPDPLLEIAIQGESSSSNAPPGLVDFTVEMGKVDLGKLETGKLELEGEEGRKAMKRVHVVAIALRLTELEFGNPVLTAWRGKIRQTEQKLRSLSQKYQKRQRDLAVAQAESAWRSSWPRD